MTKSQSKTFDSIHVSFGKKIPKVCFNWEGCSSTIIFYQRNGGKQVAQVQDLTYLRNCELQNDKNFEDINVFQLPLNTKINRDQYYVNVEGNYLIRLVITAG